MYGPKLLLCGVTKQKNRYSALSFSCFYGYDTQNHPFQNNKILNTCELGYF
jgi:alpha-D-ribose 1-methylphosphonate 5-phosphate C-P lyase